MVSIYMITQATLDNLVFKIAELAKPCKVILFGSYGRGEAKPQSDVDLLVIKPRVENRGMEMVKLRAAIGGIGAGVDVLVFSETDVKEWGHLPGTTLYWALKDGKLLYETP